MPGPPSKSPSSSKRSFSSNSPKGACPCIDSFTSFGLFIWTEDQDAAPAPPKLESSAKSVIAKPTNYLFMPVAVAEDTFPCDYCDFVFPVLLGHPHLTPLNNTWIKKITEQFKPGCYLAAIATPVSPKVEHVPVSLHGQPNFKTFLERLNANLYFVMFSANPLDKNFTRQATIDRLDDVEAVPGYHFPATYKEPSLAQKAVPAKGAKKGGKLKQMAGVPRALKRYCDRVQLLKGRQTGLVLGGKTDAAGGGHAEPVLERFNFLLAQDSFAVIINHMQSSPSPVNGHSSPYLRLIRPGAYVSFEGSVRYAQLSQRTLTYLNRGHFLSRLSSYPLVLLQEGLKAFDVYYVNDGLDATLAGSCPISSLLQLDWYQLQMDFKLDGASRPYKGHIVRLEELTNLLSTFRLSQMEFDYEQAASLHFLELPDKNVDPEEQDKKILLSLQQVTYNYGSKLAGTLEVLWSAYIRLQQDHLGDTCSTGPVYLYLKSFQLNFHWSRVSESSKASQKMDFEVIASSERTVSRADLYRAGWSPLLFHQWLPIYLNRLYPYQNGIAQWLLKETRKLSTHDVRTKFFIRPTIMVDKLVYRNAYINARIKPTHETDGSSGAGAAEQATESTMLKSK